MSYLRRLIGPFTAVWLLVHIGGVAVESAAWAVADDLECTCAHGDHAICPMHHRPALRHGRCAMRATDTGELAVSSLLIAPAIVTAGTGTVSPLTSAPVVRADAADVRAGHTHPLSPPPRA
jgi:hypothetical protein